ncbi:MAG: aldo/keto reductase, partial [Candidatus Hydrogenedentes bacterium]|nr:aldo/keto reductase [Candidatus Hydrogenedentota bacterium]
MKYSYLSNTGVQVSRVCLGTMTFGKEADEKTSVALMDKALEHGINFLDTANIYNKGLTEEIVGRWLGPHRNDVVLASKAHFPTGDGVNERGSSRRHIMMAVEASLKRLKTDWLDMLYLHHWDEYTAVDESFAAMATLVEQGKLRYAAVSNFSAWQTMKTLAVCERRGYPRPVALQPMYNLVKRQAEVEILPMAQSENVAVCPYSPIAAGLLTGKYLSEESGRIRENDMYSKRYGEAMYFEVARQFAAFAAKGGYSPAALAAAWTLGHP